MGIRITNEKQAEGYTAHTMPEGSLGVSEDDRYYFRTGHAVVCLNCVGDSYSGHVPRPDTQAAREVCGSPEVKILPPGTKLILEIIDDEDDI